MDQDPPKLGWNYLRERMTSCSWSPAARAAGLWAIDVLDEELGPGWPRAWSRANTCPPEVLACWWHLAGFIGTLELAASLSRLHDVPGARTIRDALRGAARNDAFMSPRVQSRLATVALGSGAEIALEPTLRAGSPPADLRLSRDGIVVTVEIAAVMRDAKTLEADQWLTEVGDQLTEIGQRYGVGFRGEVGGPLDPDETAALLRELEAHASLTALGVKLPSLRRGQVAISADRRSAGGETSFDLPRIPYDRRIADKLGNKVTQTISSGADWLFLDWMDQLWHMTSWGARPLSSKAAELAELLRRVLEPADHLAGVVMTDGAVLMRPGVPDESIRLAHGAAAISRQVDKWHSRESVLVPLRPESFDGVELWSAILDMEAGWVGREMAARGLEPPPELRA